MTNASLLTDEIEDELVRSGLDEIEFSFDGRSPDENDKMRRNGNFSRDSENALRFLEKSHGLSVAISNTQICTKEEIERHIAGDVLSTPEYLLQTFSGHLDKICFASNPAMAWPDYQGGAYEVGVIQCQGKRRPGQPCEIAVQTCTILSDGDVVPCCYDITGRHICGNVTKTHLFDIWNAKENVAFRNATATDALPGICQKCFVNSGRYLIKSNTAPGQKSWRRHENQGMR